MPLRVAAVQDCPVLLDRAATLGPVDELIRAAAAQRAELVVLPEQSGRTVTTKKRGRK
jgi:predicted amidohydrolase